MKTCFLLCLLAFGCAVQSEAQEALYVYSQGECNAVDIHNVEVINVTGDVVDIAIGVSYCQADVDSITFRKPSMETGRIGWWGNLSFGHSACYYQSFSKEFPDMTFEASGGFCTAATFFLPTDAFSPFSPLRKVGRKWRYVKNTLSGRRKLQLHLTPTSDIHYPDDGSSARPDIDMTNWFDHCPTQEIRKAVNLWYHPQDTANIPSAPLFGTVERKMNGRTEHVSYNVSLKDYADSISFRIGFQADITGIVRTDTLQIVFPDGLTAKQEYEMMDTWNDNYTRFDLQDNIISIVETFEAPIADVMRWLVRFDVDVCRPVYIREEE